MPKANSFDEAWANATKSGKPKEEIQEEKSNQPQDQQVEETHQHPEDESHLDKVVEDKTPAETEQIDYRDLYEKELQRSKSWEGRIRKANNSSKEALEEVARLRAENESLRKAQTEGRQAAAPKIDLDSADEETIQAFLKEFPDLQGPLEAIIRKEARALIAEEMKDIKPKVQKFEESEAERAAREAASADEAHFAVIRAAHPDYEGLVDDGSLDKWISSKPSILQGALEAVRDKGTASEVMEMFDTMKAELGLRVAPKPKEKLGDKQERLKSMVAVPAGSGGPPPDAPNKSDFDGAWKEAIRR